MSPCKISQMFEESDVRIKIISDRAWFRSFGNLFQKIIIVSFEDCFFAIRTYAKLENGQFVPEKGTTSCCKI